MEQRKLATIEKVIFLKSVDIFSHATIEELGRVAALTEEVHFEPGETILRQGEPTDAIYLILAGRVTIESNGRVVREVTDRQAFGTVAALDRNPAVHTLKAMDAVHGLNYPLRTLMTSFPLLSSVFALSFTLAAGHPRGTVMLGNC